MVEAIRIIGAAATLGGTIAPWFWPGFPNGITTDTVWRLVFSCAMLVACLIFTIAACWQMPFMKPMRQLLTAIGEKITVLNAAIDRWRPLLILFVLFVYAAILGLGLITLNKIQAVVELHATQFIGEFPQNMPNINELMSDGANKIIVAMDFPAYGIYSNPDEFDKYSTWMKKAMKEKRLTVIVYDKLNSDRATKRQFSGTNIEQIKATKTYEHYKARFSANTEHNTKEEFFESLRLLHRGFLKELIDGGAVVHLSHEEMPVYVWLNGKQRAIFSFYNMKEGGNSPEVSFHSVDKHLINVLDSIVAGYLGSSSATLKNIEEYDKAQK